MTEIKFKNTMKYAEPNEHLVVEVEWYQYGGPAVMLVDSNLPREYGGLVAMASVNLPQPPAPGCFWLKTWSENEGVEELMTREGLIERTGREQKSGFVTAYEVKAIGPLVELFNETIERFGAEH